MQKKYAMSNMGYAIVLIIILGVFMIISAPMIMDSYKNDNKNSQNRENSYERDNDYDARSERHARDRRRGNYSDEFQMDNLMNEIRNLEARFDSRLNELEMHQREIQETPHESSKNNTISDKFICSIEGYLDADGNFVTLDNKTAVQGGKNQKFVFVCEYRE